MPIPKPKPRETEEDFMARCMHAIRDEYDSNDQRVAVCLRTYQSKPKKANKEEAAVTGPVQTKDYGFDVKTVTDKGQFEGYASTFGNVDAGGDKVAPGAFIDSLAKHRRNGTMPLMLWSHDPQSPVGTWDDLAEDGKGLYCKGDLLIGQGVPEADKVYALLKARAVRGLSIGYRIIEAEEDGAVRVLRQLELPEISIVSFPMNQRATVEAVKSGRWDRLQEFAQRLRDGEPLPVKEFEDILREAGVPKRMATDIASVGYAKAIRSESGGGEAASALVARLEAVAKAFTE